MSAACIAMCYLGGTLRSGKQFPLPLGTFICACDSLRRIHSRCCLPTLHSRRRGTSSRARHRVRAASFLGRAWRWPPRIRRGILASGYVPHLSCSASSVGVIPCVPLGRQARPVIHLVREFPGAVAHRIEQPGSWPSKWRWERAAHAVNAFEHAGDQMPNKGAGANRRPALQLRVRFHSIVLSAGHRRCRAVAQFRRWAHRSQQP